MNAILSKLIGAGILFLLIFLSGFWLSRSGRPYPAILFTGHKLVALGGLIFLAVTVFKVHQSAPLQTIQIIGAALAAGCFIAAIVTGGLLSLDKAMPLFLLRVHQTIPYLTVVSAGATLYLVLFGGSQILTTLH
jgi:hypothetical protein